MAQSGTYIFKYIHIMFVNISHWIAKAKSKESTILQIKPSILHFIWASIPRSIGWRHGLQALTVVVFSTFILGTNICSNIQEIIVIHLGIFYRSATLYHPQRRAILHLKTQKRKIKDKNKSLNDTPPFFDLSCLKSRTIQIILLSTGVSALGVNGPINYLVK